MPFKNKFLISKVLPAALSPPPPATPLVGGRSWLCFSTSQTCVYCFTCRLICADTTKCALFLIRKGICCRSHALEGLTGHEQSMEHIDAMITFCCRCN